MDKEERRIIGDYCLRYIATTPFVGHLRFSWEAFNNQVSDVLSI